MGVEGYTRDGTGDTAVPWYTSPPCPVCTNWYSYPGHSYYNTIPIDSYTIDADLGYSHYNVIPLVSTPL